MVWPCELCDSSGLVSDDGIGKGAWVVACLHAGRGVDDWLGFEGWRAS